MKTRVQVMLGSNEREACRQEADLEGLSLSAWFRKLALERLSPVGFQRLRSEDLEAVFQACDTREQGREPDWEEHLSTIERSRRAGFPDL